MKRWSGWVALSIIFTLLVGCSSANNYIKETYPLVDVQGKGKNNTKIYYAENQDVPAVAEEIAQIEAPKEKSKQSNEKMVLVYKEKIINIQMDSANKKSSLIFIDSTQYAKDNYAPDILKTYLTATVLSGLLDEIVNSNYDTDGTQADSSQSTKSPPVKKDSETPTTSDRTGSFSSKSNTKSKSSSSALLRKNDGSTPSFKKPTTSKKSGAFSTKQEK